MLSGWKDNGRRCEKRTAIKDRPAPALACCRVPFVSRAVRARKSFVGRFGGVGVGGECIGRRITRRLET